MNASEITERTRRLIDVAMGRTPAHMVVRNGQWVCVQSGEIIENTDIAVYGQRIAYVGRDASHTISESTHVIDAQGRYLLPGLLDAHMHVESGMLSVSEFVRAVVPHGTTGMFIDPHEIANIFGLKGVRLMADEASIQPIHVWVQMPSCIPSAPGFETPGAVVDSMDIAEAMSWDDVIGLGEMMNFPAVINSDPKMIREIAETVAAGKVVGGHFAARINDHAIHGYAAAGVEDDHEGTTLEDAVTRIRQGMKAMLRYGSAWHDVAEGVRAITELGQDPRNFILCTDDSHSQTLVDEGHVNRAVNQAILHGVDPVSAIQMATINTAEHFRLTRDVGMIAPGRFADIIVIEDIDKIAPILVIGKGDVLYQDSQLRIPPPQFRYPDWILESINIPSQIDKGDFTLSVNPSGRSKVVANVIGVLENQAPTKRLKLDITPNNGKIHPDIQRDIAKLALIERHHGTGKTQVGLVHGFGFTSRCAVASTVAHDSHHMVIVGTDETDMAIAANELIKIGGGQTVVREGNVLASVELPIAGIISNKEAETVSHEVSMLLDAFRECGCRINNPNMQLSLLALVVIPELRISDLGLVDVTSQRFIPVIEP